MKPAICHSARWWCWLPLLLAGPAGAASPPPITALWARGYSVVPTPQKVTLAAGETVVDGTWPIVASGLPTNHQALRWLMADLQEFHGLRLSPGQKPNQSKQIRLAVQPGSVSPDKVPGAPTDPKILSQAYRLTVAANLIEITGNSDAGLFYGVQTLVQLLKRDASGAVRAPEGVIADWPKLQLRFLHWDTKNHQDRLATLRRYLDWSARLKVNMIAFELEDKFAYPSHPVIGAPGAFTATELQALVAYAQERYIQIVPVIQSPAHLKYVLKHPEFAHLRADGNNYQAKLCEEDTYKLIFEMFDDVIRATPGVEYFFVSTDEVYYAGIEGTCGVYTPESRSQRWAEFARRAHDFLAQRGRRMLAWIEYPLLAQHLPLIPSGVIDGVMGDAAYLPIEREKKMRQLIYVSLQGSEFLFPDDFTVGAELQDPPPGGPDDPWEFERGSTVGRIQSVFQDVQSSRVWQGDPIGVFGAAWDDSGLHNETFWLGWSAVAQYGWNAGAASPEQHTSEFMRFYYGPRTEGLAEVYRGLQIQARTWQRTWDRVVSRVRGPGYGNSDGKGVGSTRYDAALTPPPLPDPGSLAFQPKFAATYSKFLAQAQRRLVDNDRLAHALAEQFGKAERNRYNLEVLLALNRFVGHHWNLLLALTEAERLLEQASATAQKGDAARAVGALVNAYNLVEQTDTEGRDVFRHLVAVFEKSQLPKGQAVGGRQFFQVLDDTKDHWAARTAGWEYMAAPEQTLGLGPWRARLLQTAEAYAKAHGVPVTGLKKARLED